LEDYLLKSKKFIGGISVHMQKFKEEIIAFVSNRKNILFIINYCIFYLFGFLEYNYKNIN